MVARLCRNFSGATIVYRVNCVRPFASSPSVMRVGENANSTLPRAVACAGNVAATSKLVTGQFGRFSTYLTSLPDSTPRRAGR